MGNQTPRCAGRQTGGGGMKRVAVLFGGISAEREVSL
ncbi:hypothetical protein, partial [Pseudomonas sp. EL_65y_Pfl1_R32]